MPNHPEFMDLKSLEALKLEENEQRWVSFYISDFSCQSAIHPEETNNYWIIEIFEMLFHYTASEYDEMLLENTPKSIIIHAKFEIVDDVSCGKLSSDYQLTGTIEEATESRLAYIEKIFPSHITDPNTAKYFFFCGYCGREDTFFLFILCMSFALLGILIYPLVLREQIKRVASKKHLQKHR